MSYSCVIKATCDLFATDWVQIFTCLPVAVKDDSLVFPLLLAVACLTGAQVDIV